jgi:hypothetical protein
LDSLATDSTTPARAPVDKTSGDDDDDLTPQAQEQTRSQSSGQKLSTSNLASTTVVDAIVEVIIPSSPLDKGGRREYQSSKSGLDHGPMQANMIISVWHLEEDKYFTLTFTSASPHIAPVETRASRRTVVRTITSVSRPQGSVSSNSSSRRSLKGGANSPGSSATSPMVKTPNFPPHGPPSVTSSHSVFQKASQLKVSDYCLGGD